MADDLTAELDRIAAELRTFGASNEDTARLLAAVEKVLELADRYDTIPGYGPTPATRHEVARRIRETITRELNGKGESDV